MGKKLKQMLPALAVATVLALGVAGTAACKDQIGRTENLTDEPLAGTKIADWEGGEPGDIVFESNGWTNGGDFNTLWNPDNVVYEEGVARLTISENPNGAEKDSNEYFGGEMRTYNYYGYGDYEVCMKVSDVAGTASTFFTCTGPYDAENPEYKVDEDGNQVKDENGNPILINGNPHDEIDIEFLGKDTTKVQFNYFVDGVGGHEFMYDLGFDASEGFHEYGFRWAEDHITWFVDNKPVYRIDAAANRPMPSTAGRILMNYWTGTSNLDDWMGNYKGGGENGPEYKWVSTSAQTDWVDPSKPEPPKDITIPSTGTTAIDLSKAVIGGDAVYTTKVEDGKLNVTYSGVDNASWKRVTIDGFTDDLKKNNVIAFKATNNSDRVVDLRADILCENGTDSNGTCNIYATQDGVVVSTNLQYGGSTFELAAGATVQIIVQYDTSKVPTRLELMFDSADGTDKGLAGDVTVSDLLLFTYGELPEVPETPEEPEDPEDPEAPANAPTFVDMEDVTLQGSVVENNGLYTATKAESNDAFDVAYTDVKGNSYLNVELGGLASVAQQNNVFTAKIRNNGTAQVAVRVNIQSAEDVTVNTKACNISATQDGVAARTDTEWGGSFFTVDPGKTIVIAVVYDNAKTQNTIQFMVDSHLGDETARSGNITIGAMAFYGSAYEGEITLPELPAYSGDHVTPPEGGDEEDPVTPPVEEGAKLTFTDQAEYVVENSGVASNEVHITYTGVTCDYGNVYDSINTADTQGMNTFTFTVVNNGDNMVQIRFDLQGEGGTLVATDIKGTSVWKNGGEMYFQVQAGATETISITFSAPLNGVVAFIDSTIADAPAGTTYSGDITLKDFKFTNVA